MIILFDLVKRDLGTVGPAGKTAFQQPDQLASMGEGVFQHIPGGAGGFVHNGPFKAGNGV